MKSLKSVPSTTSSSVSPLITDETRRLYLQTNEYFLNQGLIDLVQHITTTISPHLTRYSLDQLLTFADTLQLLGTLRQAIETPQTSALWSRILLPTEHASTLPPHFSSTASSNPLSEADKLVLLLNETRDIIESPPFSVLIQKCAHVTFANTLCYLKNAFGNQSIPVAKLIPLLHRHCSNLLQTENNEILATIAFNKEITDYSLFALQTSFLEEYPI
jgi:peroxin-3